MSGSKATAATSDSISALQAGAPVVALMGSAGLLAASFDSPGWLASVTLLPLLYAVSSLRPVAAMASGVLWGASLFAFLSVGGHVPADSSLLAVALLVSAPAAYAFFGAVFTRRYCVSALLLGFGWAGVELAVSPVGLSGGLLVGTMGVKAVGTVGLLQSVLGYVCLAAFIAAVNSLLLSILHRAYVHVRSSSRRYVYGRTGVPRRFFPQEVAAELLCHVNPTQARAPPA